MSIKVEQIGGNNCEVTGAFSHTEVYVSLLENFASLTEPKGVCGTGAATTLEDLVTITTPHTFKLGFGFTKVKAIQQTVGLETAQLGDPTKSVVQENKLTFQLLGSKAEILAFKRLYKGKDIVVLATEFASGQVRQIGSAKFAGKITEMSSKIEATTEGENTTTIVVSDKQNYDAPIYKGTITTQPA